MSSLRYTAAELMRLFAHAASPLYVLDEDRKIVFCNSACAAAVGIEADDLVGLVCEYHSPLDGSAAATVAAALCPPPRVFAGQAATASLRVTRPDGRTICRLGYFFPLADGQDQSAEVLAVLGTADVNDAEATAQAELHEQVRRFRARLARRYQSDRLLGISAAMARVRAQIDLASASRATVLLTGPPGSGREHAAKAIHYGQSASSILVPIDCSMLETNLLRSTLRALWSKHGGEAGATLLLSHADVAPPEVQAELLELLDSGAQGVRVLSTAAQPLVELAASDGYSKELAHRLATITIELPPLAARLEDLPVLAQALLEQVNVASPKQVEGFSGEALDQLALHAWPGNLDELAQVVSQAHAAAQGPRVEPRDLAREVRWSADAASHPGHGDDAIELEEFLKRVELELITRALRRAKGNKSKAARLLGLTRPRLYRRLVQLGLEQPGDQHPERQR